VAFWDLVKNELTLGFAIAKVSILISRAIVATYSISNDAQYVALQ
jgi:hypothetical protein